MRSLPASLILLAVLAVYLSIVVHCSAGKEQAAGDCKEKKMERIQECSLCCATRGFNKFDHKQFLEKQGCRCFMDEAEMKLNSGRSSRVRGRQ